MIGVAGTQGRRAQELAKALGRSQGRSPFAGPLGDLRYRLAMEYLKQVIGHALTLAVTTMFVLAHRARAREMRAAGLERELALAKLRALQMQLEPHFLFNALNLVSSCIRVDPPRAESMLAYLSDVLRATLRAGDAQEVRLEHELAAVTAYLEIMKARFADRLGVVFDVAAESRAALVPNLVLQPLAENAVKHGPRRHGREAATLATRIREAGSYNHGGGPGAATRGGLRLPRPTPEGGEHQALTTRDERRR